MTSVGRIRTGEISGTAAHAGNLEDNDWSGLFRPCRSKAEAFCLQRVAD